MSLTRLCRGSARLFAAVICLAAVDGYAAPDEEFQSNLMSSFTRESHDVALDVETPAEAYADKPIVLHVTLRNETLYDIAWNSSGVEQDLGIRVRDDEGRLVPLTALGKSRLGFYDPATHSIYSGIAADHEGRLHSRQSAQWDIVISDFFVVHPGSRYHIEVSQSMQVQDSYDAGFKIAILDLPFWVLKD